MAFISEHKGTKVEQAISMARQAVDLLEQVVRETQAKLDAQTGKPGSLKICNTNNWYNPIRKFAAHRSDYTWQGLAAQALQELEKLEREIVARHEANTPIIENNKEIRQALGVYLANLGWPESYTTWEFKSKRATRKVAVEHTSGWVEDMHRWIPINDGFEPTIYLINKHREEIAKFETERRREDEKNKRENESAQKKKERDVLLGVMGVKYGLPVKAVTDAFEVMEAITSKNKYLALGWALEQNRGDWSDGCDYAEMGLDNFDIENDVDKKIFENINSLCGENWDGDGRIFRDCTWNYSALYGLVEDEDLINDHRTVANIMQSNYY